MINLRTFLREHEFTQYAVTKNACGLIGDQTLSGIVSGKKKPRKKTRAGIIVGLFNLGVKFEELATIEELAT